MRFLSKPQNGTLRLLQMMIWLLLPVCSAFSSVHAQQTPAPLRAPMALDSRLLLNRMSILGYRNVDVMLLLDRKGFTQYVSAIESAGANVRRSEAAIGYARVEIPIQQVARLLALGGIDAYLVGSSLSEGGWDRDAQFEWIANLYRGGEIDSVIESQSSVKREDLPLLPANVAREKGYTAEEDTGVGLWLAKHPSFDGRGTTIALVESAASEFHHPIMGSAKTLEGAEVPKLAGILNAIDPDSPDHSRVDLDAEFTAPTLWYRVADQTLILPRPGHFRYGQLLVNVGANLIARFGVIRDESTGEIWVDSNGDRDFTDEKSMRDVSERADVGALKFTQPRVAELSFTVGRGRTADSVHVYLGSAVHQTMTLSVAAGSRNAAGLAYGVAPGARVLLAKRAGGDGRHSLQDYVETYIEVMQRPDVDVISDSANTRMVPDSAQNFLSLFFSRLTDAYGKPVMTGAGNSRNKFATASAQGSALSVGGVMGPATFAAFSSGGELPRAVVHPMSAFGPGFDGTLKPDLLAPMNRVSATVCGGMAEGKVIPKNAPRWRLPPCYQLSGGTSSASPYAAGVAALLISAAKQERVAYSQESLSRALRFGARFLPNAQSYQQGNGVIDVNSAWQYLKRGLRDPAIQSTGENVQPLTPYAASGGRGPGIFEREGWVAGMQGTRTLHLMRRAGGAGTIMYRLSWTGNDGTFSAARSISLPLDRTVQLPIRMNPGTSGAHSAILNLHDPKSGAIVFRAQAVVVAAEPFSSPDKVLRIAGSLPLLGTQNHFIAVPKNTAALVLQIEVRHGTLMAAVLPSSGLDNNYLRYQQRVPKWIDRSTRTLAKGTYSVMLPRPAAGNLNLFLANHSASEEPDLSLVSMENADYVVTAKLLDVAVVPQSLTDGKVVLTMTNASSEIREPQLETSLGVLRSHQGAFADDGLAQQFDMTVPAAATSLRIQAKTAAGTKTELELYLYDCTSGECFLHDFTVPAASEQELIVRRPKAGRWVAAVNAAPAVVAIGSFVLDELVTTSTQRRPLAKGETWRTGTRRTETIEVGSAFAINSAGAPAMGTAFAGAVTHTDKLPFEAQRVAVYDIIDAAAERDELGTPGISQADMEKLTTRPVALGTAIVRLTAPH